MLKLALFGSFSKFNMTVSLCYYEIQTDLLAYIIYQFPLYLSKAQNKYYHRQVEVLFLVYDCMKIRMIFIFIVAVANVIYTHIYTTITLYFRSVLTQEFESSDYNSFPISPMKYLKQPS